MSRMPPRLIVLALVLGLVLVQVGVFPRIGITTPAAYATDDDQDVFAFTEEIVDAANTYRTGLFQELGRTYRSPNLVLARHGNPEPSDCDEGEPAVKHSYCSLDETITLDISSDDDDAFTGVNSDGRPMVILYTAGHEFGHHVQHVLDLQGLEGDFLDNVRYELQADCLAGMFIRAYARASDWVERADVEDAIVSACESGDPEDIPGKDRTHGTPAERAQAFQRGYNASAPAACSIPT